MFAICNNNGNLIMIFLYLYYIFFAFLVVVVFLSYSYYLFKPSYYIIPRSITIMFINVILRGITEKSNGRDIQARY